jgi:hypothetical protein
MLTIHVEGLDRLRERLGADLSPHVRNLTLGGRGSTGVGRLSLTRQRRKRTGRTRSTSAGKKWGRTQWYVRGEGPHWLVMNPQSVRPSRSAGGARVRESIGVMGIEHFKRTSEQLGSSG